MSTVGPIQIPRNLLFRYRFKCNRIKKIATKFEQFPESNQIPMLGRLEGQTEFAKLRCGWNDDSFAVAFRIQGKKQALWCRPNQPLESDGVQFWIDTRDTHNVHRATRYCHWFVALPTMTGGVVAPACAMLKINRAREDSPTLNRTKTTGHATIESDGYEIVVQVPSSLLNGWSPSEQPTIGFFAAVVDRELGWNTLSLGPELPIAEDPSLWCSMQLS